MAFLDLPTAAGTPPLPRVSLACQSSAPARLGQWMHLAFSTDGMLLRLLINGVPVAEQTWLGQHGEALFLASLRAGASLQGFRGEVPPGYCVVEQDDIVLHGRVVPPEQLASLAACGRGGWARELARPELGRRAWGVGWPITLGGVVVLVALQVLPRLRSWVQESARSLAGSGGRAVRWVLLCGGLITAVLTGALLRHAARTDQARFDEATAQLDQEMGWYWEKVASLLGQARDWVAAQSHLDQKGWETWLKSHHYPHDYPGLIGVGYAEQVQPEDLAAHEARWSAEYGIPYRVWPAPGPQRERVAELAGNPLLPVVLYGAGFLPKLQWLTSGSILGRDLLYRPMDDPRGWCEGRRIEVAAARNEMISSGVETIAPAGWFGEAVEGLRLYVPWTLRTKEVHGPTVPLESAGWRGVVFGSVDLRELLLARYGEGAVIGCRVHAGGLSGELQGLAADTGQLVPANAERPDALCREQLSIPHYYHRLYVDVWTTPAFAATSLRRWAWIAGTCSGGLTLLSAALLLAQARSRTRLERVLADLHRAHGDLYLSDRKREEMSRDLHDGSIQNLYALGLHLQRVQQSLPEGAGLARAGLSDGLELLNQSIGELRRFLLTAGLGDAAQNTVPTALETLADRLRKTSPAEVTLQVAPEAAALGARHGVQVINVVREAASNALRHAGARHITIRLEPDGVSARGGRRWLVEVSDDGCGFDAGAGAAPGRGLANLAARAEELGGTSAIFSTPGGGTRVRMEFEVMAAAGQGPVGNGGDH